MDRLHARLIENDLRATTAHHETQRSLARLMDFIDARAGWRAASSAASSTSPISSSACSSRSVLHPASAVLSCRVHCPDTGRLIPCARCFRSSLRSGAEPSNVECGAKTVRIPDSQHVSPGSAPQPYPAEPAR
jgi:hypothetical protein